MGKRSNARAPKNQYEYLFVNHRVLYSHYMKSPADALKTRKESEVQILTIRSTEQGILQFHHQRTSDKSRQRCRDEGKSESLVLCPIIPNGGIKLKTSKGSERKHLKTVPTRKCLYEIRVVPKSFFHV